MNHGADSSIPASGTKNASQPRPSPRTADGPALFWAALRARPLRVGFGLIVEYGMFASGLGLALGLLVARVPLRLLDGAFGLELRERFIDLVARISPG